ncbi:X-ray repair cross-complementing protein 5 isoform X2 [Fopius arisanus]|nr:PREDICTED: X-ray repair cross-complementing protein 5-like isoform X2 [Fopius arisanus]
MNAKEMTKNMIEKKIFTKPRHEAGIILMGVKDDDSDFRICNHQEIQSVSWDMVKAVSEIEGSEGVFTKWLSGLKSALKIINTAYGRLIKCKIVLISNFPADPSQNFNNFDKLVEHFVDSEMTFVCCGPKNLQDKPPENLNKNEQKILEFCRAVNGFYCPFDYILPESRFYETGCTRFCPWMCNLEVHSIKIPIRVAVRASRTNTKAMWSLVSVETADGEKRAAPVPITQTKELVDRYKTVHEKQDTVKGYMCGNKFIPVTQEDEAGMELGHEAKSFKLYGVAKAETVSIIHRTGPSTWLVMPENGFEEPFFYFLQAMKNSNLVGFARRNYRDGGKSPMMNLLIPCTDDPELPWCFLMYQLIFAEEEHKVDPVSLNSVIEGLSKEEKDTVDELIDLMFVEGEEEGTSKNIVPAPERQHLWNVKAFRALHPDEPLPPPKDYLMALLEPPDSINAQEVRYCVERIKKSFELQPEEVMEVAVAEGNKIPDTPPNDVVDKEEENVDERDMQNLDGMFAE